MNERTLTGLISLLTVGASCTLATAAGLTPVSQTRTVQGQAHAENPKQTDDDGGDAAAGDFGPFVEARSGNAKVSGAYSSGGSSQNSTIEAGGIDARGSAFANAGAYDCDAFATATGRSVCDIRFQIDEAIDFTCAVTLAVYDNGGVGFSFTGPGGPVVELDPEYNYEVSIEASGTLTPGEYRVNTRASGGAFGDCSFKDYAFASFDFELTLDVAIPGDADGDGDVDLQDLIELLTQWGPCEGACSADFNNDGMVGFDDLLILLENWGS